MNYCGIDLAGVSSYAFVTDEKGNKLWSGPIETEKIAFERLVKKFIPTGFRSRSRPAIKRPGCMRSS